MTAQTIRKAGNALFWQAVKMGGVKVIYLVRILILARLLTPDDLGLVAIAVTATGFLFNLTNLGLFPALVQGTNLDDSHYDSAWTLDLLRSLLLTIITIAAAPVIAVLFDEPRAVPFIMVLSIRPLIEALTSIKVASLNRDLTFRPLAVLRIVEAVVNTVLTGLLALSLGAWSLVAGTIGGTAAVVIVSYILAPYRPRIFMSLEAIRPLIHFGRWIFANNIISLIANYILRVLITRQFGSAGLGIYYMASQLAFLPGDIASEVVGSVAFPLFARLQNDVKQATQVFRAMFSGLAAILYPVCALFIVLSSSITREILGENWTGAGDILRILALVVLFGIFGEVTVAIFKGFGQPFWITLLEVTQSLITISLVWVLAQWLGLVGAAAAWLPAILLSQILSIVFLQKILHRPFQGLHKPLMAVLVATGLCAVTAAAVNQVIPGMAGLVLAAALGLLFAGLSLWLADRHYNLGFLRSLALAFPQISAFIRQPSMKNIKSSTDSI